MSLSNRIVVGLCIFAMAMTAAFVFGGGAILKRVETTLLSLNAENASVAAVQVLQRSEKTLTTHGRTISRSRDSMNALKDGDFAALKEDLTSTFNRASASGEISDLIIFDKDGTSVAAFSTQDEPLKQAGTPEIVRQIKDSRQRAFEITQIDDTRIGAVYAFPLFSGRNVVGYGLLALDAQSSLPVIAEAMQMSVLLAEVHPNADWTLQGYEAPLVAEADPEADVAAGPDQAEITSTAMNALAGNDLTFDVIATGEQHFVAARNRIGVNQDGTAFDLILLSDFSAQQAEKSAVIFRAMGALLGMIALFLGAMLIWCRRQLRPLREGTQALASAARGDEAEPLKYRSSAKEIAELHASIELLLAQRASEKVAAEEIAEVVEACARGDFTGQLGTEDKEGIFKEICVKVNSIGSSANEGLEAVRSGLSHMEQQDLTYRMPDGFQGIFGDIATSMNTATDSLSEKINLVSKSAAVVENVSSEVSRTTDSVAANSEQNAAALEETAAALEQMSSTVGSMAASATEANTSVDDITNRAAQGQQVMSLAVEAMAEIEAATDSIDGTLAVIEDIAFQTNLLALNAGVEAARAGEAGQGFAVVASEVRALAQKSSESARQISELIKTTGSTVERGVSLVRDTGKAFDEIVVGVNGATDQIRHIAAATKDTSVGINEINVAVGRLDKSTQENAAAFFEVNTAMQGAQSESKILSSTVSGFKVMQAPDMDAEDVDEDRFVA
ncbi:methyl-accepting chemotaxis protein [Shimia sagamensis]|uniref:Methyl-accepting chemotaxis protein n=1 Tax=Shimia sagamensis TaxID=1566352 RepID=A0ABY1P8Q4_9RHOB|nr:methyl-accepting chemotaxis protein [Shimia sagamensis]SMP29054.1 Methyl-accepting chemotaxis protein [Shimia sagamensis]